MGILLLRGQRDVSTEYQLIKPQSGSIYKTCKIQNGIVGITRNDQARHRFCVTWSERSQISEDTRHLFGLEDDEKNLHSLDLTALNPDVSEMMM